MQVSNSIHYSSDPYLLSKQQHKAEDKSETRVDPDDEVHNDISAAKLEEKLYAKSVNAVPPTNSAAASDRDGNSTSEISSSTQNAIASYAEVENSASSQERFNQVQEMV